MSDVVAIRPIGSHLCTIRLHRHADGTIGCVLQGDMDPRLIETTGDDVVDRMEIMARWIDAAAADFRAQAARLRPALEK